MKHALIIAHPSASSYTASMARAYAEAVRAGGAQVAVRDLYAMDFDPRLADAEIPRPTGFRTQQDVEAERRAIADADVFALFYPLWFNAPPAIIVGYVQRVFGMGFGYGPIHGGGNQPLLTGRSMISFSSSGAPREWLEREGGWAALRNLFDSHVAEVCGLNVIDHVHFGAISPATRPDVIARDLQAVADAARRVDGLAAPSRDAS